MKTYSLAEVAAQVLPTDWIDPERWLRRHLNSGAIRGYRVGRTWRLTQAHLDWLIERFSNDVQQAEVVEPSEPVGPVSILAGMSERARARIERQERSAS